jgi:GNAT superfamily N-acetyltransferase
MIKRITNPDEFCQVCDDIYSLFEEENKQAGHELLLHNLETFKKAFSHTSILAWDFFVWANHNGNSYDAIICFMHDKNPKFNESIFSEYLWLSKNAKVGYKLFQIAVQFAREKGFKHITMSTVTKHPQHEKLKSFYTKMGFLKDSEIYIAKL